jgi:hypothetical protein
MSLHELLFFLSLGMSILLTPPAVLAVIVWRAVKRDR